MQILPGSNPLFGRNTLGGAISLEMRSGTAGPERSIRAAGGSFGRMEIDASIAEASEARSLLVAATALHENGWRDFSPSELIQFYARRTLIHEATSLSVAGALARNDRAPT